MSSRGHLIANDNDVVLCRHLPNKYCLKDAVRKIKLALRTMLLNCEIKWVGVMLYELWKEIGSKYINHQYHRYHTFTFCSVICD